MKLKKYKLDFVYKKEGLSYDYTKVPIMSESEKGDWVKHSDVKELINKLVEEGSKISEKYDQMSRSHCGSCSHEQKYWDEIISEIMS